MIVVASGSHAILESKDDDGEIIRSDSVPHRIIIDTTNSNTTCRGCGVCGNSGYKW